MKIICIGGGAASFFFAANISKSQPDWDITILEQGRHVLNKVLVSGGGRCNVTHACYDPKELIHSYPRGKKEMLGPFYNFGPTELIDWFQVRGVELKVEDDGRMFPITNDSSTIANCLMDECKRNGVKIWTRKKVTNIIPIENGEKGFDIHLLDKSKLTSDLLFVAPGSSKQVWQILSHLGLDIVPAVPSLFTFQLADKEMSKLAGITLREVYLRAGELDLETEGPILITHKGLSGPSILKMSAWGARILKEINYKFKLHVDFHPQKTREDLLDDIQTHPKSQVSNHHILGVPKRLGLALLKKNYIDPTLKIAQCNKATIEKIISFLKDSKFQIVGQNRFKEEFVTAGGVNLKEVNFKNFSCKKIPNMYMAGEVLNIDAVTGGFNFQAAWTGAYLAAQGAKSNYK